MAPLGNEDAERLERSIHDAFVMAENCDWRSHDPFDLLLSPCLRGLQSSSRGLARVAVQVGKRSGGRLRSALRIPLHEEPKAIADYLRTAARLARTGSPWAPRFVQPLTRRLVSAGRLSSGGFAWGLGFPYTSRFVNVRTGTPNTYVTMAVTEALLDASELLGDDALLRPVENGCRFLVDTLGTFGHGGRQWLRYWPGSEDRIVNVQALAASLMSRASRRLNDQRLAEIADEAAATTLSAQRPDGSWFYSDEGRAPFVDGFHTGFVLQGLTEYAARRHEPVPGVKVAVDDGLRYFKERLLGSNGLPLRVSDGRISLDPQNVAQCVQTLVVCAAQAEDAEAGFRVWNQVERLGRSPLRAQSGMASLRWSLGPGVLAAAHLLGRTCEQTVPPARSSSAAR